ncbi:MAG: hypothetical protein HC905_28090 [Bacteroidales bacterium]|nr:hypothetical protein [Bacteroidales bacterium]
MDSVNTGDTIYTCESFDSIKIVPMSDYVAGVWWMVGGNLPPAYDYLGWPDTLNIYLPDYFIGQVTCDGTDGVGYLQKTIEIVTTNLQIQNISGSCGNQVQLNANTNYLGGNIQFNWMPVDGLSDTTVPNPVLNVTKDMEYSVTMNTPNCTLSKDVLVTLQPAPGPSICLVSVDIANKNMIYWENPESVLIDSFFIYKETNITGIYEKIGIVDSEKKLFYR